MATCLIADDSKIIRMVLSKIMANLGFDVLEAEDGEDVIKIWKRQPLDLIIMDWRLPVMEGIDVLYMIRSNHKMNQPKIIFCSSLKDEDKIREKVRIYKNAMAKYLPEGSMPEFASKAFSCRAVYRIMAEEGIDVDVVSSGELYTAFSAGFPMENVFFHGNNKTDSDITFAMEKGVGFFVVDGAEELYAIQTEAENKGITQKILLRITPGIDPHTHKKISTGSEESKFGIPLRCGAALDMTKAALSMKNIHLCGFHCHVGSQIFECEPFINAAEIMFKFFADVKEALGYTPENFNIGGGLGVRYTSSDPVIYYDEKI